MSGEDIKPGYKRTEVGVIPEDWEVCKLANLVDPNRTIRYGIVQPGRYEPNGRLMIRGQDYSKGWVDSSELFRVSENIEKQFENARVKTGDVLITIVGASTGRIAIVPAWLDGANLTQTTARIATQSSRLNEFFCSYVLASPIGEKQVANFIKGAAQPGLNCGDIGKFLIPIPSAPEQNSIATALSDVDALLAKLDQLIAKKRDLKQATMQQLLTGQTRLPGFSGAWQVKRLGDVLTYLGNGAVYEPTNSFGLPVTRIETIANGVIDFSRVGYAIPTDEIKKYKLKKGDVLFSHINSIDHIGKVAIYESDATLYHGMNLLLLRPAEAIASRYLFYWLSSTHGRKQSATMAKQAVSQASINTVELRGIEIPLPSFAEQTAIATVLSDIDAELATLESRRDKTRALKQGMMQELLTGRIRLV